MSEIRQSRVLNLLSINRKIVLASKSPRRKKMLEMLELDFEVIPSNIKESEINLPEQPEKYAGMLSAKKALEVASRLSEPAYVIGADTIVVLDGEIINKPKDFDDAVGILNKLSGKTHLVFTGISIVESETKRVITKVQKTSVSFRELEQEEILAYIQSGSPLDKAGAYGIQDDFGALFVNHIEGCYYNIVGLPLELLYTTLKEFSKSEF